MHAHPGHHQRGAIREQEGGSQELPVETESTGGLSIAREGAQSLLFIKVQNHMVPIHELNF